MRTGHGVAIAQRQARSDDGRFLTDATVVGAGNRAFHEETRALFFEPADAQHAAVGFGLLCLTKRHLAPGAFAARQALSVIEVVSVFPVRDRSSLQSVLRILDCSAEVLPLLALEVRIMLQIVLAEVCLGGGRADPGLDCLERRMRQW